MTTFTDIDWSDLETKDLSKDAGKKKPLIQFPCQKCSGRGEVTWGYVNIQSGKCFACNGRGYFNTSPEQRKKAKSAYVVKKFNKEIENVGSFKEQLPEVFEFLLQQAARNNNFATSLIEGIKKYGSLTDGQVKAVHKFMEKVVESKKPVEASAVIDLSIVREKFENARTNHIKRPIMRVIGFVLSRAPDTGKNPGAIYVKSENDEYLGKVDSIGNFFKARTCSDEQVKSIIDVSKDVLSAAIAYGRKSGNCSCCGRTLTKGESIDLGIGPICREKWGL